jgi:hypothetical protein
MYFPNTDRAVSTLQADTRWEVIIAVVGWGGFAFFAVAAAISAADNIWIGAAVLVPALPYLAVANANLVRRMCVSNDWFIKLVRRRGVVRVSLSDVTSIERRASRFSPRQTILLKVRRRTYPLFLEEETDNNEFREHVARLHPGLPVIGWSVADAKVD